MQVVAPRGSFHGDITCIVSEGPEVLWIGSSGGVHRWEHGQVVRTWNTSDGLLTASVRTLFRDFDGTLWIGTHGGGLARLKDGRIFNITTRHGLIDDVISQIVADDFGYLSLGCNRGIMRLERRELHALADGKISELHPVSFGKSEGMLNEQCVGGRSPTAIKMRDGRLLFPTAGGIAEISPRRLESVMTIAPQASIDGIVVDGRLSPFDAGLVIPPGKHRIEVSFSAPALRSGEWVHFRHLLEGVDRDWVKTSGNGPATYDGLPPGDYFFRVVASDGQGKWNEPGAKLAVTVQPFYWQTLWFRAFGVLLLVGASSAAAWWLLHLKHLRQLAELARERKQQTDLAHAGRVALLGELSASLAHELKQPLAAILSNAQAALRFLKDDSVHVSEVRNILKDITSEDRRASEIIDRLRTMVKKGEMQMEARDLNADVEQVLLLLRSELATRHVSVDTELAPDLPPVRGDHIQLQQVLLNLVINGSDAMHAKAPAERRLVIVTARDGTAHVRVSVTDGGAGIAPEMLERIFEPFYSTKESGLGMGLAICRAIIKAHGGFLWAENNPGRGATFHFTLMLGEQSSLKPTPRCRVFRARPVGPESYFGSRAFCRLLPCILPRVPSRSSAANTHDLAPPNRPLLAAALASPAARNTPQSRRSVSVHSLPRTANSSWPSKTSPGRCGRIGASPWWRWVNCSPLPRWRSNSSCAILPAPPPAMPTTSPSRETSARSRRRCSIRGRSRCACRRRAATIFSRAA